jgi:hypothetical protein
MQTIMRTNDYSLFRPHENNRTVDQGNVRRLISSLQARNMLEFRPILVNARMQIIDGNHRFHAAKALGLDIYYQIAQDSNSEDIILLNANQKRWGLDDYIHYYISKGNVEFKKLKDFCDEKGISVNLFYRLLGGDNNKLSEKTKYGSFKFPTGEDLEEVNRLIEGIELVTGALQRYIPNSQALRNSMKLKYAVVYLLKNPDVDIKTLMNKITYKAESLRKCADTDSYLQMLRDIYNWKNKEPI